MDKLIISDEILTAISTHVQEEYPLECCGVLLGKNSQNEKLILEVVRAENHSKNLKNRSFSISPIDFFQIEKKAGQRNLQVSGFYHSHPEGNAVLSDEDIRFMIPVLSYPIISIKNDYTGRVQLTIRSYKKDFQGEIEEEEIICR